MDDYKFSKRARDKFRFYLPMACAWVLEQERYILENGVPLSAAQRADAKLAGVVHPEKVRLMRVEHIPLPQYPELREMVETMKLTAPPILALALRYGIYILSEHWGQRRLLVHELAHTAQYERLGSVPAFVECYLYQCLAIGFTASPMEQEAIAVTRQICGPDHALNVPQPSLTHFAEVESSA